MAEIRESVKPGILRKAGPTSRQESSDIEIHEDTVVITQRPFVLGRSRFQVAIRIL